MTQIEWLLDKLTYKHILLLLAYKSERNKRQARDAIVCELNQKMSMGANVLPFTQELLDLKLIRRTNPGEPSNKGHKHLITSEGLQVLDLYSQRIEAVTHRNPNFGY